MKKSNLVVYKILLTALISSLAITGISFLDNQIWNLVMLIVGMITYAIVGLLFSLGLIAGKNAGKEAYAAVFIILLLIGYCIYEGIVKIQQWVLSWPLFVKILIPIILGLLIAGTITILIVKKRKNTDEYE